MRDYENTAKALRCCRLTSERGCAECPFGLNNNEKCANLLPDAADAIEELLRIGAKMHTWIFLHTTDEQAAYDEIGLTDEQNALFGYSGQMILKAEPPKEVE